MEHCEKMACTGVDTVCLSQGQRITRLRASKKELEGEVRQLVVEVGRLNDALKLANRRLTIEMGANKAHVANLQGLIESSDKQIRTREESTLEILAERDRLRIKADAMHLVIAPLSIKAGISEEALLSLLGEAERGMRP